MTDLCPHCDRGWHGLAITERMEQMRAEYQREQWRRNFLEDGEPEYATSAILDDYRYADDTSRVLCPGSLFIGPRAPTDAEARRANKERRRSVENPRWINFRSQPWIDDGSPILDPDQPCAYGGLIPQRRELEISFTIDTRPFAEDQRAVLNRLEEAAARCATATAGIGDVLRQIADAAPEPPTPQQRALPRPSSTPPMWARQPNQRRRNRRM